MHFLETGYTKTKSVPQGALSVIKERNKEQIMIAECDKCRDIHKVQWQA